MGILKDDAQGAAEAVLFDVPHVYAVVGDAAPLHLVKAVDEVGDGGLARAGGAHEGDLLARLGVEADPLQDGLPRLIAEVHLLKAHIPPQGRQAAVRPAPRPAAGFFGAGGHGSALLLHVDQLHLPLVGLRRLLPLRSGQRGQQEVALLGHLVDGHGRLPDKDQIAGQAAHVGHALQRHDAAQHRHKGVIDVGDADHRRNHGGRIALRAGARFPQGLVLLPERPQAFLLVVEHLDHLLPGHHLLDIAVQLPQAVLLLLVIGLAPPPTEADVEEHEDIKHRHDEGKLPIEQKQHGEGAHHLDRTLDEHGKAVVERLRDRVHVVGEVAHHIAVALGVKKAEGQGLDVGEQIPPDVVEHLLGRLHHDLGIAQRREHPCAVDGGSDRHAQHQGVEAAGRQTVDHRPDHIGAKKVSQGAEGHQHRHGQEQQLVPSQVGQQGAQRVAQVLGFFSTQLPGRHGPPPLSSEMRRSPGRWDRPPAGSRGCPPHAPGRPPG